MLKNRKAFLLLSFFILFFSFSFALGKPAFAACTANPRITEVGESNGVRSVTYHIVLENNCAATSDFRVRVTDLPESPSHFYGTWQVKDDNGTWGAEGATVIRRVPGNGSEQVDVKVIRDIDTYNEDGWYWWVKIRASLDSDTSVNDTIDDLKYNVYNRPDLHITQFSYPSGDTCSTSDVKFVIKNIGWRGTSNNFDVTVNNDNGKTRTFRVTETISAKETKNLSPEFRNMPLDPPIKGYIAVAKIDTRNPDEVTEEDETDNRDTSNYSTSACPVTPPPPTVPPSSYNISGTIFIDTDNSRTISAADTRYTGAGTISIGGTSRTDSPDPTNGTYSISGNLNGTYSVGLSGLSSGYSVFSTNPISVTISGANSNNNNFLVTPPGVPPPSTYNIDGALFIDSDPPSPDGIRSSSEPKKAGSFRIIGSGVDRITTSIDGGNYVFSGLLQGPYTISYRSLDIANYRMTYPTGGVGFPSFNVTVGTSCNKGTHNSATCILAPNPLSGSIKDLNFGIIGITTITGEKWIQGVGGDIRSDNRYDNIIPGTDNYFSQANSTSPQMTPGVVFLTSSSNLGNPIDQSLKANENQWFITDKPFASGSIRTSYQKVKDNITKGGQWNSQIPLFDTTLAPCGSPPSSDCTLPSALGKGIYTSSKPTTNLKFSAGTFSPGNDYIFMIDGNLNIESDFTVPKTTTVFFIVKGDITVADDVTNISGIYSADKNFTVNSNGGTDDQLFIEGSVIANAGKTGGTFINSRDLGALNNSEPSVKLIYRPDFILNAPELIRYSNYIIKEVGPGE